LDELISHLLDMSRLETGKLPVELGATDVRPILIESVSRMAAHAPSHKLVVNLPSTLPPAQADPRRVVQVVCNLLDNALKFSPPGATVTVDAEATSDTIRVRVRDEGRGSRRSTCRTSLIAFIVWKKPVSGQAGRDWGWRSARDW